MNVDTTADIRGRPESVVCTRSVLVPRGAA